MNSTQRQGPPWIHKEKHGKARNTIERPVTPCIDDEQHKKDNETLVYTRNITERQGATPW